MKKERPPLLKADTYLKIFLLSRNPFLNVSTTVLIEEIPPELIINWDQTGMKIVHSSSWTMNTRGAQQLDLLAEQ